MVVGSPKIQDVTSPEQMASFLVPGVILVEQALSPIRELLVVTRYACHDYTLRVTVPYWSSWLIGGTAR